LDLRRKIHRHHLHAKRKNKRDDTGRRHPYPSVQNNTVTGRRAPQPLQPRHPVRTDQYCIKSTGLDAPIIPNSDSFVKFAGALSTRPGHQFGKKCPMDSSNLLLTDIPVVEICLQLVWHLPTILPSESTRTQALFPLSLYSVHHFRQPSVHSRFSGS
jgi:hypothetical protein